MLRLTPQLLDSYPYSRYADPKTIQRGQAYYKEDRVWDIDLSEDGSTAVCMVDGNSGEYTVGIEVDQESGQLYFDCDCPFAENYFCKHMVAAALELSEYLKDEQAEFDEKDEEAFIPTFQAKHPGTGKANSTKRLPWHRVAPLQVTTPIMLPWSS